FNLEDIRYVRPPATDATKDATVGIFTKDDDYILSFSGLDDEDVTLHDVGSFARLLGNYQNQVREELPRIEAPELVASASKALLDACPPKHCIDAHLRPPESRPAVRADQ